MPTPNVFHYLRLQDTRSPRTGGAVNADTSAATIVTPADSP